MDPLVLRPLPVPAPDRLVTFVPERMDVRAFMPEVPEDVIQRSLGRNPSNSEFDQLVARSELFSGSFDYARASSNFTIRTGEEGRDGESPVVVAQASGEFFSTLGVAMTLGRPFFESDREPDQPPVAVISDALWRSGFGQAADVIGKTVTLIQSPQISRMESQVTIIGVAAPDFDGIEAGTVADLWKPYAGVPVRGTRSRGPEELGWWTGGFAMARLRPGVSLAEARLQTNAIYQQLLAEWSAALGSEWTPDQREQFLGQRMDVISAAEGWTLVWGRLGQSLVILLAGVSCLLLIGCANVGALLLARGESRRGELTLRMAMGCGRIRLVRQLLTESLTVALIGGLVGLATAYGAVRLLLVYAPEAGTIAGSVALDGRVFAFAMVATLVSAVLFGLVPALRTTRLDLNPALKGSRDNGPGPASHWKVGRILVVSQLALSLVLLVGAGLFVQTLQNLRGTNTGFDRQQVVRFALDRMTLPSRELLDRIEALPGIESATVSSDVGLLGGHAAEIPIQVEASVLSGAENRTAVPTMVGLRFFETMGIRVLAGRTFRPEDAGRAEEVALISETMATRLFGDENPVGQRFFSPAARFLMIDTPAASDRGVEIIGVVEDVVSQSLRAEPPSSVYFPIAPTTVPDLFNFAVRTSLGLGETATSIESILGTIDSDVRIARIQTMNDLVEATIARERFLAQLATTFGLLAMLLTCIGLYGTLSFAVAQRTREIGIRMALGARIRDVIGRLMAEAGSTVALGLVLGIGGALMATRTISNLLFGVTATDPATIAISALFLIAACAIAAYLPARRASRVDPLVALRHD
jgi:predicted permease